MIEPTIGYAVFNRDGNEADASSVNPRAGYGILNQPSGFYGTVSDDPADPDLQSFLRTAKLMWRQERALDDFKNSDDKWSYFIGQTIDAWELNRSDASFRVKQLAWFTASYRATSLHTGILEPTQIMDQFRGTPRKLISATTDEGQNTTLTFDDGLTFVLMPLYFGITNAKPNWITPSADHVLKLKENL